jgi:hypothetical protein
MEEGRIIRNEVWAQSCYGYERFDYIVIIMFDNIAIHLFCRLHKQICEEAHSIFIEEFLVRIGDIPE